MVHCYTLNKLKSEMKITVNNKHVYQEWKKEGLI